ncbi:hypothetical protein [Amycolatopsis sp. NPDC054798]
MSLSQLEVLNRRFEEFVDADTLPALDAWALGVESEQQWLRGGEVRDLLADRSTEQSARDAVWGELVRRVQREKEPWQTYAIGLMVPALRRVTWRILNKRSGDRSEVESAAVVGLVEALGAADPTRRRLAWSLQEAAYQRASGVDGDRASVSRPEFSGADLLRQVPVVAPAGHVDLVLARAVRAGAVTDVEADIFVATRFEDVTLEAVAERLRLPYPECAFRLQSAERELLSFIRSGE